MFTKTCAKSGRIFTVRDQDIKFYDRISPTINGHKLLIPPPTLCPEERDRRRLAFRNERHLYARKCALTGKQIISNLRQEAKRTVYAHEVWWSDRWDPLEYGREYNFSESFFAQFKRLLETVPTTPLVNNKSENSDYCNYSDQNKNCYLITTANRNQDCYYGFLMVENLDAVDSLWLISSELTYQAIDSHNCYNVKYVQNCHNCTDSAFLYNCTGLKNCLFCINLRNKQYQIFNKPVTKAAYQNYMDSLAGNQQAYSRAIQTFQQFMKDNPIRKAVNHLNSENVTGENIFNSNNIHYGFDVYDSRDLAYVHDGLKAVDCMDVDYFDGVELCYESTSLIGYGYRFTNFCRDSYNLFYCDNCHGCKDCFGCIGLRKKQYCIFNKQYTKSEYETLFMKIVQQMIQTGEWGEFFPMELSPFKYEESLAQDYFPLPIIKSTAKKQLPQKDMPVCETCGGNFKLITQELDFYKKMQLPIPQNCPNCRHLERVNKRNPRKLFLRECSSCQKQIETSFSPKTTTKIYCEQCFLTTSKDNL